MFSNDVGKVDNKPPALTQWMPDTFICVASIFSPATLLGSPVLLLIYWDFHVQLSQEFTQNGLKKGEKI